MQRDELIRSARKAKKEEKYILPFMAFVILLMPLLFFFDLIPAEYALVAIVPIALAGLSEN